MSRLMLRALPVLLFAAAPLLAQATGTPAMMIPLLPSDRDGSIAFTAESWQQALQSRQGQPGEPGALPAALLAAAKPAESDAEVFPRGAAWLLARKIARSGAYLEGVGGGSPLPSGWPWTAGGTMVARSTYGEVGLGLLAACRQAPTEELLAALREMARSLQEDFAHDGPLAATNRPFVADVIFLARFQESGLGEGGVDYLG